MSSRTKRPTVALVSEHASPLAVLGGVDAGGQNVHVAALAEHVAKRGWRVDVFTRRDDPHLPRRVRLCTGVSVVHVDAGPAMPVPKDELLPYMSTFADVLHRTWSAAPPDIVHAHFWMSGRAALAAGRRLGLPVVQTFHALGIVKRRQQGARDTSPPGRLATEARLVRTVDHVIATCTDEVFELVRLGGDRSRMSVVPCGVDASAFTPGGSVERRGLARRLVVVSRLVERKGIGNVIAALAEVPDTELVIAGGPERTRLADDPEARRLLQLAHEHGVAERVDLRGQLRRHELPPLLRSADAVVCVPWYEPFGIVPLEAMACARPVVASAVGGLIDTVVDGVTGVHVPPRDVERLADALRGLLGDRAAAERMGRAGRLRVEERYGWERVADATLACYRRLAVTTPSVREVSG
jgi:D-inositol-3-phosphate glycosyltransferase